MTESIYRFKCRSCLDTLSTKRYPLLGEVVNVEFDVVTMLEFCTSSKLDLSEDLPNYVCISCFKTIRIAYLFLKRFYEAQTKLNQLRNNLKQSNSLSFKLDKENLPKYDYNDIDPQPLETFKNEDLENVEIHYEEVDNEYRENIIVIESKDESDDTFSEEDHSLNKGELEDNTLIKEEDVEEEEEDQEIDLVEALNLGDTDIDQTNIEIVVDSNKQNRDVKYYKYICPICNEKFCRVGTFYSHVKKYNLSKIRCTRCKSQPELDIVDYFEHYVKYHKYHCDICGKVMASSYGFDYHMKHHENIRSFKCPIEGCNKSFLMNYLLKQHIKSHTVKNNYACPICDSLFNTKDTLRYHLKLHDGKKDHLCTICGQAFYQAVHLRDHIYRHTGYKKYVCDICGKRFITNGSLKKHILYCSKKHNFINDPNGTN